MRIGFDVDGVLADFNTSYVSLVRRCTGRDLFASDVVEQIAAGVYPNTWNWPEALGYDYQTEIKGKIWSDYMMKQTSFWENLGIMPEFQKKGDIRIDQMARDHEMYFITNRVGSTAKQQTERWIRRWFNVQNPTVLITENKGDAAGVLRLEFYIDDKWENVAKQTYPKDTAVYLLNRPWNVAGTPSGTKDLMITDEGTTYVRVNSVREALNAGGIL